MSEHKQGAPTHESHESTSLSSKMSEMGTTVLQSFKPIKGHCMHLNAIHGYADDPTRQVEANHYCSHVAEHVHQCVIYDSDEANAKLIGVEYIIPRSEFEKLPVEEKKYWHSHVFEVKSGLLVMPGIPQLMEDREMNNLVNTYGKTWHFWQTDRGDRLPYGEPKLMCALTKVGQVNPQLAKMRDEKFGINHLTVREHRAEKWQDVFPHPQADQFPGLEKLTMQGEERPLEKVL